MREWARQVCGGEAAHAEALGWECASGDQEGGQNKHRARGGEGREARGDGVYPTDGTRSPLPGTFSEALSDAVVRGASEGRGEAAKLGTRIGGTSAGPPSS